MGHASVVDVQTVMMRALTAPETELAERLLTVAASTLRGRIAGLEERMLTDLDFADLVSYTEASAVKRVLQNPEGISYETIGPFSAQRPQSQITDGVSFTKAELAALGVGSGAFTIRPHMERPTLPAGVPPPWYWDFPSGEVA